ncbi:MAG: ubiquinone biosynthesis protein UbiA [Chitinophagaceae bacterium]|nr:ubiquinone biosynthesis protein UbiA [Chitinophagaceae bacterium]
MKQLAAFFRLIRWPNLVFIVLAQWLFSYCIMIPVLRFVHVEPNIYDGYLVLLSLASVLIAAGGYIINDYFDLNIDRVNKPDKLVVEKYINRRWVIAWHFILSIAGIVISFYIDYKTNVRFLGLLNMLCVILLFVYSISLKKKLLAGNILISLLTAWTVLVITYCETNNLVTLRHTGVTEKITRLSFLYGGFAFVISLIREVIKDMEDVEGDRRYGCRTMPIAWGINVSKVFTGVWMVVLFVTILILQFYILQFAWWYSIIYCVLLIIIPLFTAMQKLSKANSAEDFHRLSSFIKLIMLTGILSMISFLFY